MKEIHPGIIGSEGDWDLQWKSEKGYGAAAPDGTRRSRNCGEILKTESTGAAVSVIELWRTNKRGCGDIRSRETIV
ncbi:hypothetical protein TNCV_2206861 [Trichonephila clavipes]|uniref:Uncharacterized protein n=1 Tax=Trichonephila clavipes TaxID=2585209 RepID=A0A8X6VGJ7_TRICX|nr:hypothetical protein TNCV_2206861 [Trichonephila clavipes]